MAVRTGKYACCRPGRALSAMMCGMDMDLKARLEAAARSVRAELGATPDAQQVQSVLFEQGVHGIDAVLVTMQVLGVPFREASGAYFSSPLRVADREFQNAFTDAASSHLTLPTGNALTCLEAAD